MKGRIIGFWIATGLFSLGMLGGGIMDFQLAPQIQEAARHLGYPDYFMRWLGVAKILGALALLQPWQGRLREWAYAGFTFELIGAAVSHASVGDGAAQVAPPFVFLGVLAASFFLRPQPAKDTATQPKLAGA